MSQLAYLSRSLTLVVSPHSFITARNKRRVQQRNKSGNYEANQCNLFSLLEFFVMEAVTKPWQQPAALHHYSSLQGVKVERLCHIPCKSKNNLSQVWPHRVCFSVLTSHLLRFLLLILVFLPHFHINGVSFQYQQPDDDQDHGHRGHQGPQGHIYGLRLETGSRLVSGKSGEKNGQRKFTW